MFFRDFSNSLRFSLENFEFVRISESLFFAKKAAVAFSISTKFLFFSKYFFFSGFSDFRIFGFFGFFFCFGFFQFFDFFASSFSVSLDEFLRSCFATRAR